MAKVDRRGQLKEWLINKNKMSKIETLSKEISTELANESVQRALVATTFKGLDVKKMKQALLEGMMRGFVFKDFLEKNVYAIPFRDGYSLVTSIDYARKVGMKSGVVGKSEPVYEEKDEKIISCTITIKRKVGEYIGDYTAKVYFDEYNTGRNLWQTKPRTMIAKVAEMHALRMACPEELARAYVEEEMQRETDGVVLIEDNYRKEIDEIKTIDELRTYWQAHKGMGKEFDAYVTERKKQIENENS